MVVAWFLANRNDSTIFLNEHMPKLGQLEGILALLEAKNLWVLSVLVIKHAKRRISTESLSGKKESISAVWAGYTEGNK